MKNKTILLIIIFILLFSILSYSKKEVKIVNKKSIITKEDVIAITNKDRLKYNLLPLTENVLLNMSAEAKVNDMFNKQYFDHNSPAGVKPWYWIEIAGYNSYYAGENLAQGFYLIETMQNSFMESPGHRANILNKDYKDIGVAIKTGMYNENEVTFTVVHFGFLKNKL